MILLEFENKKYTIDEDYNIEPINKSLGETVKTIELSYDSPALGFKTSYIASELEKQGINVIDVYDKEMEDAPEGVVY